MSSKRTMKDDTVRVDTALTLNQHTSNPWDHESPSIASIRNSLILAEQMGLKTMEDEKDSKYAHRLAQLPSSKLIAIQREVASKNKSIHKLRKDTASDLQEKKTADIVHIDIIEKRINMVKQLCRDLDAVLRNADVLVHRLMKPFAHDCIKMDAAYHRYANEVFMQLVPTLNDLTLHLDNLTWASNNDFTSSQFEPLLVEIQSLGASVRTSYHTLCQMRRGVEIFSSKIVDPITLDTPNDAGGISGTSNGSQSSDAASNNNTLIQTGSLRKSDFDGPR